MYSCVGPRPELGIDLLLLNFEHFLSVQRAKVVTPLFHRYAHAPPQNTFLPRFPGEKIDFLGVRNTHEETNHVRTTMRIRRHGLDKLYAKLAANPSIRRSWMNCWCWTGIDGYCLAICPVGRLVCACLWNVKGTCSDASEIVIEFNNWKILYFFQFKQIKIHWKTIFINSSVVCIEIEWYYLMKLWK